MKEGNEDRLNKIEFDFVYNIDKKTFSFDNVKIDNFDDNSVVADINNDFLVSNYPKIKLHINDN